MDLDRILASAKRSGKLAKLNFILQRGIPFNRQHNIKIVELKEDRVAAYIPFKRKNLNHINGIHACGLATVAEFCSGLALLNVLGSKEYRLIMSSLRMEYHYQAKSGARAVFELTDDLVASKVKEPLEYEDSVELECEVPVHDDEGNHLCTAFINWHIKPWDKVRTKVT